MTKKKLLLKAIFFNILFCKLIATHPCELLLLYKEISSISVSDVESICVDRICMKSFPCQHSATLVLKDGRSVSGLNSFQICSIVEAIEKEKINPQSNWDADSVRTHFACYNESIPEMGWEAEPAEVVLKKLFSSKSSEKLS